MHNSSVTFIALLHLDEWCKFSRYAGTLIHVDIYALMMCGTLHFMKMIGVNISSHDLHRRFNHSYLIYDFYSVIISVIVADILASFMNGEWPVLNSVLCNVLVVLVNCM